MAMTQEFAASFIDAVFALTEDECWERDAKHLAERHLVSAEEAKRMAAKNPSQIHSAFEIDWDLERIKDELVLDVLDNESFVKGLYAEYKEGYYSFLTPAKGCGKSYSCNRDRAGKIVGFVEEVCNTAVVVFDVELARESVYKMRVVTVYPANRAIIKKIKFGKF